MFGFAVKGVLNMKIIVNDKILVFEDFKIENGQKFLSILCLWSGKLKAKSLDRLHSVSSSRDQ